LIVLQIKGYDAKGSQFFRFTTPITDDIKHICVASTCLFAFTDTSVTIFDETTERCCYTAPEKITAATIAPLVSADTWWPLVACQDRTLKVLNDTKVVQV
jgi:Bardet-Biedl syndrome 7 protein